MKIGQAVVDDALHVKALLDHGTHGLLVQRTWLIRQTPDEAQDGLANLALPPLRLTACLDLQNHGVPLRGIGMSNIVQILVERHLLSGRRSRRQRQKRRRGNIASKTDTRRGRMQGWSDLSRGNRQDYITPRKTTPQSAGANRGAAIIRCQESGPAGSPLLRQHFLPVALVHHARLHHEAHLTHHRDIVERITRHSH